MLIGKVWKEQLKIVDAQTIMLRTETPVRGSIIDKVLCMKTQHDMPVLYYNANEACEEKPLMLWCIGTGQSVGGAPQHARYIGTTMHNDGYLVYHWYAACDDTFICDVCDKEFNVEEMDSSILGSEVCELCACFLQGGKNA